MRASAEIAADRHLLTPVRDVGAEAVEDDEGAIEGKTPRHVQELASQFKESETLEKEIRKNLKGLGYDF